MRHGRSAWRLGVLFACGAGLALSVWACGSAQPPVVPSTRGVTDEPPPPPPPAPTTPPAPAKPDPVIGRQVQMAESPGSLDGGKSR
jgi:hypothetical protein